jgi:hypothetical protein
MISLHIVFWLLVLFFAMVGYMRGWQKEIIAMTGLIASIAALHQFANLLVSLIPGTGDPAVLGADPMAIRRQQFWIQAVFHSIIAFFSFQVVGRIADQLFGGRLGERLRAGLEKRVIGLIIGAANGYLFVGGLWSFLEYQVTPNGYVQLLLTEFYPFGPHILQRPALDSAAMTIAGLLPMGVFSPTLWLVLFFISFFVVIIALI